MAGKHVRRGGWHASGATNILARWSVVVLAIAGAAVIAAGILRPWESDSDPAPTVAAKATATPSTAPALVRSVPVSLEVPTIGVKTPLMELGLNADKTVQVPPLTQEAPAGWYKNSPSPGEKGPAIILGHVDTKPYGPAVFYRLGQLKPGARVTVRRADAKVVHFQVTEVARYHKTNFPTEKVYGNINHAGLRLITCGGKFNISRRTYDDNTVVYATLVSS